MLVEGFRGFVNFGEIVVLLVVFGIDNYSEVFVDFKKIFGVEVFEIVFLLFCVFGMCFNNKFVVIVKNECVDYVFGLKVIGCMVVDGKVVFVIVGIVGVGKEIKVDVVVFVGGGFEFGVFKFDFYGYLYEIIFDLLVIMLEGVKEEDFIYGDYWGFL